MRKLLFKLSYFLLLISFTSSGQGFDNIWMMGYGAGGARFNLDFTTGVRNIYSSPRQMRITMTSLTYCNELGQVLFYTNGVYIANAADDPMLNGTDLSPCYYTTNVGPTGLFIAQAALAIPWPESNEKYFLFHSSVDDSIAYTYKMYYSLIDMNLDAGLGAVVTKNNILVNDTLMYGRLTATKHANGRDWWVVFHGGKNDKFYIYLVDPTGINLHAIQHIGGSLVSAQGQVCFSQDGSMFALYDAVNDLHLLDFDRCSGVFSNHLYVSINDSASGGGVAFSPNSQVLYVSSLKYIYQFDLNAINIAASQTTVAVWDGYFSPNPPFACTFYLSKLAPDNKIYVNSNNGVVDMHVIEYPDNLGVGCSVCQHCVALPGVNGTTIPNHPNYHLGKLAGSVCDSLQTGIGDISDKEDEEFIVFPNPVKDKMYIKNPANIGSVQVVIYNSLLQEMSFPVALINNGEYYELNTSRLLSGVYFLEITTEKQKVVKKFVKG